MKLLIAVGATPKTEEGPAAVKALLAAASEIRVMSPSVVGTFQWLSGDVDEARRIADDRLTEMLGRLEPSSTTTGSVGDELAENAFADIFRTFQADHVLLIAASTARLWQQRKVLDNLLESHGVSVTLVLV